LFVTSQGQVKRAALSSGVVLPSQSYVLLVDIIQVSSDDAIAMAAWGNEEGLFCGISSGVLGSVLQSRWARGAAAGPGTAAV